MIDGNLNAISHLHAGLMSKIPLDLNKYAPRYRWFFIIPPRNVYEKLKYITIFLDFCVVKILGFQKSNYVGRNRYFCSRFQMQPAPRFLSRKYGNINYSRKLLQFTSRRHFLCFSILEFLVIKQPFLNAPKRLYNIFRKGTKRSLDRITCSVSDGATPKIMRSKNTKWYHSIAFG